MNVGAPACGMNAAMRSFVRFAINRKYRVKAIPEGFRGMKRNNIKDFHWTDVRGWAGLGGSAIGARRTTPDEIGLDVVAAKFRELQLHGLLIVGGFEAFVSLLQLFEARSKYPEFRIPMAVIPATISNNVPGTDFSLGCDTAINEITQMIDKLKQSAKGSTRRVFVVETMGGYCGYLATMSGLAGGADAAYIFEENFNVDALCDDVKHVCAKMEDNVKRGLILVADSANKNFNTDFIHRLYMEEGKDVFDCRLNVFGHVQQGGVPTPFDRNFGTKTGTKAIIWMDEKLQQLTNKEDNTIAETMADDTAVLLGLVKRESTFTPIINLKKETDFQHRIPKQEWWLKLRSLMRIMAKHDTLLCID
jgi:6-phosphofructokinase 1